MRFARESEFRGVCDALRAPASVEEAAVGAAGGRLVAAASVVPDVREPRANLAAAFGLSRVGAVTKIG